MEKAELKEEKIEDIVQKLVNGQITEIKEETKKEKISISLNKISSLNINEFQLNISIPDTKSQEALEFIVEFNLIYNKIHLYSINIKELSDCRDLYPDIMQTLNDNFIKEKVQNTKIPEFNPRTKKDKETNNTNTNLYDLNDINPDNIETLVENLLQDSDSEEIKTIKAFVCILYMS